MVYDYSQQQQPPVSGQTPYGQPMVPPAGVISAMPPAKWSGLATGGAFKVPVIAFIGRLTDILYDTQSQFGMRIIEKFDQVQILESPAPWPWATIDLSIKYSDREDSGWGRHVGSARAIGVAADAASLEEAKAELVGKVYEMRQMSESYGEDPKTGDSFRGDVWRFMRVVIPGGAPLPQQPAQPQYVQPQPQPTMQPQPVVVPAPAPIANPTPAPAINPTAAPTGAFSTIIIADDTAPIRAKKLLDGKTLNEFLGVALIDDKIKADSAFTASIFDQSFIVGLKAAAQVTVDGDGRHHVVA